MTCDERGKRRNERTTALKKAVIDVCLAAKKSKKKEVRAEDYITVAKVAKMIKKSVSTVYRWLESCGLSFEDLRNDALRQVFRE
jgi:hypothetical protein